MSHLTQITTSICDLTTLQKILTQLEISWEKDFLPINAKENNRTLIISQANLVDIGFTFNKQTQTYELFADKSFWNQCLTTDLFLNKIIWLYAVEYINKELNYLGFPVLDFCIQNEKGKVNLIAENRFA